MRSNFASSNSTFSFLPSASRMTACCCRHTTSLFTGLTAAFGRGFGTGCAFGFGSSAAASWNVAHPAASMSSPQATAAPIALSFFRSMIRVTTSARETGTPAGKCTPTAADCPSRHARGKTVSEPLTADGNAARRAVGRAKPFRFRPAASRFRASASLLLSVPVAMPSRAAASLRGRPSSSHNTTAARCASDRLAISASRAAASSKSGRCGSTGTSGNSAVRVTLARRRADITRASWAVRQATPYSHAPTASGGRTSAARRASTRNTA